MKKQLLLATALCSFAGIDAALAQDAIEIVTVTAAKREQNVQDVSISMNVVGQTQLENYNTRSFIDLTGMIPSFYIQKTPGNDGIYLRGFGSSPSNPGNDQTVSLYVDGVYNGRSRQYMSAFFDVQRIEILRGPQGALLGKNTAAGAISVVTAGPTEEFEAKITASYNFDRKGVEAFGHIAGPITDELSARLAGTFLKKDGYIRNIATNRMDPRDDEKGFRLTLQFEPDETVTANLKFTYNSFHQKGQRSNSVPLLVPLEDSLNSPAVEVKNTPGPFGMEAFARQNDYNAVGRFDIDLGGLTLTSITGFSAFKANVLASGGVVNPENSLAIFLENFSQGSQEFRLLSPTGQTFEWIVGAYADYSNYRMFNVSGYIFGPPFNSNGQTTIRFRQTSFSYSIFATGTWHITDDLRLQGSARYTRSGKNANFVSTVDFGTPLLGATGRTLSGQIPEEHFDPSVTVEYDVTDDIMVYASYARGSKSGAFEVLNRGVIPGGFATKAETSTNYEIGAKTQIWDWLTFNAAAFILDFKNLQVSAFNPALFANTTNNAGAATSQGIELTFTARVTEGLVISGSGAYLDAHFTDYPGAACTRPQTVPPQVPPCTPATNNLKGYPLQFASKWTWNLNADYTREIFDDLKFNLNGAIEFRSSHYVASDYDPIYGILPSYAKINARVAIGAVDDAWEVALIGKNLTDVRTTGQASQWPFEGPTVVGIHLNELRTIALQGSLRF